MAKVEDILTKVEEMTVLELAELIKKMEEKFGVSAAAPMMVGGGGAAGVETAEVKDEFDVVLVSAGDKKIQVLKVLREVTGLGLKEAKDLVDTAPKPLKQGIKKEEAGEIKKKLEAEGAKVEIK
ncbi:50S ribosomal protein L7/L12 [candidate division WOR-1 bacterium RIFCSPLOWO2_02_FULL_46_20]|uniref:Large ribosomal subunit protein bL12 n=2 Tax=Saganbacteria TaxID=1703751 RepID=A0A1F4R534_UNCSA|nr:MAG: 50S ribosomal protein L7/L12 [candidate division WOR-1 bacterium RIFCSPHIGHO2_02_FULL_45_12]OGC03282.1 MAG: 50S ribosomal protein L7/L12 [candidate division WOR-1 bacterium RIFCSPLOWO2_02_FULL_46_20]OGC08928.1 MAG: 50S ribosomal protein L7/L12 [candidate division WOR-1 bacterium RIFCSPLOWO2_12_FULL_45_9]